MRTIYSEDHALHRGSFELSDGKLLPCFESPERASLVRAAIERAEMGPIEAPLKFGDKPLARVHDGRYLEFLRSAWDQWRSSGREGDALPLNWCVRGMRPIEPEHIDGKLSYYSFDAGTPITAGTWHAATAAADVALTGAKILLDGEHRVFSLCRPPGHHAAADYLGGYCFLNNAAIAAQYLIDGGAERVAILDVDYHHGNGTQSIFYARSDVLFISIHGHPQQEYPFFLGYADERGEGAGDGFNLNLPLGLQSDAATWFDALGLALERLGEFSPDAIVISLGVDTFIDDPISQFQLQSDDYLEVGSRIAALGLPMLFVLEGGYATDKIGTNVVNVLLGAADSEP